MSAVPASTVLLAQRWLSIDRDEKTRRTIEGLLKAGDADALEERLNGRIKFGTSGLRAEMDAGFTRMNYVTVAQASKGLASYVLREGPGQADGLPVTQQGVVIGFDARHNSERFAVATALAFIERGFKVWWFPTPIHTPLVPYAVQELGAAAGVMVTASHNPKNDNGYKVYWSNAAQIIPPHDSGIAAEIEMLSDEEISWNEKDGRLDGLSAQEVLGLPQVERCDVLVEEKYIEVVSGLAKKPVEQSVSIADLLQQTPFVYTPIHGTGLSIMKRVLGAVGIADKMAVVPLQAEPDPEFPTVVFPNPEEEGALDLAKETAESETVGLILASDPDADRLAVAQKLADGSWHQFTGNEVGVLFAAHVLETTASETDSRVGLFASFVSSRMMGTMAEAKSVLYRECLTGFKWIGNSALSCIKEGLIKSAYGYEEALGYMFTDVVPDKDSISAAVVFLTALARWRGLAEQGHPEGSPTAYDKLQQLRARFGYFAEANSYVRSPSAAETAALFRFIRSRGASDEESTALQQSAVAEPNVLRGIVPGKLGQYRIDRWTDITLGYDSGAAPPEHLPMLPVTKEAEMISCELVSKESSDGKSDVRLTIRASGTEPKVKFYIEARSPASMADAQRVADGVKETILAEWFSVMNKS